MPARYVFIVVALALALGMAAGYLYRRSESPTLQERAEDTAAQIKRSVEKLTK